MFTISYVKLPVWIEDPATLNAKKNVWHGMTQVLTQTNAIPCPINLNDLCRDSLPWHGIVVGAASRSRSQGLLGIFSKGKKSVGTLW